MTRSTGKRPHHFKNTLPKDPAVQRFGEWLLVNRQFYGAFYDWLKGMGYSASALHIYGIAARFALGYLRKPYWRIDPEADLALVREHIEQRCTPPAKIREYDKGLRKLGEFLRTRRGQPGKPKEIRWQTYIGILPACLQANVRNYLKYHQCFWKEEQKFELTLSTLSHLTVSLRWMATHASLGSIADLTPRVWYCYLDQRLSSGICPSTVNGELTYLKGMVFFLREQGHEICERFLLVDYLKNGSNLPRDVPIEQLRPLQEAIQFEAASRQPGQRRTGLLDLAWFLLMLHSGLRTAEIRNLKLTDIEWQARRLRIEQAKGLKDRLVYLSQASVKALEDYLEVRGPAEYLPGNMFIFCHRPLSKTYCGERLRWFGKRCGFHVTPHQLRHSCATLLLNAGAPVVTVQAILGHRNVDTTLGYARLYDGTVAADYYQAMSMVEQQLALPEDRLAQPPSLGEMLALVDALRSGTLNPAQAGIVRSLRSGLALLAEWEEDRLDVKVLCSEVDTV